MIHTGDITRPNKASKFHTPVHVLKEARAKDVFCVPGEMDSRFVTECSAA